MPARLLLLSDTHVPQRAKRLSDEVWRMVDAADVVLHAGDWTGLPLFEQLTARADVIGVWGNNDGPELRDVLPETRHFELEGVAFAMTHILGTGKDRETVAAEFAPDAAVVVFGHSHIPWDTFTPHGRRLLNPGSPTDRRRQPHHTVMTAVADAGELRDVRLVPVPRD